MANPPVKYYLVRDSYIHEYIAASNGLATDDFFDNLVKVNPTLREFLKSEAFEASCYRSRSTCAHGGNYWKCVHAEKEADDQTDLHLAKCGMSCALIQLVDIVEFNSTEYE